MKTSLTILLSIAMALFITSCDIISVEKENKIEGKTDLAINTVGNKFSTNVRIDGKNVMVSSSVKIIESEDGVNTFDVKVDLSKDASLASLNKLIPNDLKDENGMVSFTTKLKITDEGILDYSNSDGAPFISVRFDDKVGEKYVLKKSNGEKITRTVIRKSTDNDYLWNGMNIKTIDVEQTDCYPGFKRYECLFNHKFGIVGFVITTEDDSELRLGIIPEKY